MNLSNLGRFFDALRTGLLRPNLTQSEVNGLNVLLRATISWPKAWVAYGLATAYHETAHTLQPINEFGSNGYFFRMYDIQGDNPPLARRLGNVNPGDGALFHGRGYVQLTGRKNYQFADDALTLGGKLVSNPALALQETIAAPVLEHGMRLGWFSGHKLGDYLPTILDAYEEQFRDARAIINGSDRADLIAGFAMEFQAALTLAV